MNNFSCYNCKHPINKSDKTYASLGVSVAMPSSKMPADNSYNCKKCSSYFYFENDTLAYFQVYIFIKEHNELYSVIGNSLVSSPRTTILKTIIDPVKYNLAKASSQSYFAYFEEEDIKYAGYYELMKIDYVPNLNDISPLDFLTRLLKLSIFT